MEDSQAASVRAKYIVAEFKKEHEVHFQYGYKNKELFFSLASNTDGNLKRLLGEILVGVENLIRILVRPRCDHYILSSPPFLTILIIAFGLRIFNRKYSLDIRDIYPEVFFHLGLIDERSFVATVLKRLTKMVYNDASRLVCVTAGLRDIILTYNQALDVSVIYNGFDENLFYPDKKFEDFTIIFHGNLAKMQNIDLLLRVAEELPKEITVIVAGDGPQAIKIRECNRIKYLGSLKYEEVAEYVRRSHVGISFRHDGVINQTAFPVKVFEYIGSGLPVIITPKSEAGEIVERNKLGFQFDNNQVLQIVSKIKEYFQEDYKYKIDLNYSRLTQAKKMSELWKRQ